MTTANKDVVRRFNLEVIQNGDRASFEELMAPEFVNHSAPSGAPNGPESMWNTFQTVLRPAFSQLVVSIEDQIAEGEMVTTRKTITGVHTGALMGVPPSGREVSIFVIDIVRVRDGKYVEHWGLNTLPALLTSLSRP
jgi:predicted ester cyclase